MATTDVLVFARTTSEITTQANYITLSPAGNLAGSIADAFLENKCLRQVSTVASTLTLFLANATGIDITDNTTVMTVANLTPFFNNTIPTLQGNNNFSATGSMNLPNTIGGVAGSSTNNSIIYTNNRWQAGNIVPRGVIWMWSGAINSIPTGWQLCDGTNGAPDLRNKFIIGAGGNYPVAATGGTADAVVVAHTHTAQTTVNDPGHSHIYIRDIDLSGFRSHQYLDNNAGNMRTSTERTGISVSVNIENTGQSGVNANLPPYYALAFIFKT